MRKIRARAVDPKDRIVCEAVPGALVFYYRPVGTRDYVLLFQTGSFSRSVWTYFRNRGRNTNEGGFGITIRQLYEFTEYRNFKLTHVIDRIPSCVEYVIRERIEPARTRTASVDPDHSASRRPASADDKNAA